MAIKNIAAGTLSARKLKQQV